ncbi:gluconate 2-dehydrogenase subunit 3 family protein [Mucilaginibacter pedocola]|uniref:Twin-arginine translocation pathway signal protein n=1 Tax=Mucilaginibacter pedocola TaxID=1792845 RepID=A0A1S9PJK5_9SPHI|nr:gluconate 2-dehydrogenase subunit 3 family protein [Mucilaginibacter pedocola]OOQ61115.1 hypothetical protein BC343_21985 [Mucilaginibacter pedocola]
MNRRIAIRNMALILGSVAVLPSCLNDNKGKPVVKLNHLNVDAEQESLVNELTETILPKTKTPGAKDLGINLFVFKMIDDCYDKKGQDEFMAGLKEFADAVDKKHGKPFHELTAAERTAFVNDIEKQSKDPNNKDKDSKANGFYWTVKGQTVFGYTTSKYFMTEKIVYELVPGRYNAMFPVKKKASA